MDENSSLYLWQPVVWQDAPTTVDVTITRGESGRVGDGGPDFVAAVVGALGLAKPTRAKVIPFRSQRFNDDLNADEWKDRWPLGWCLLLGYDTHQKVKAVDDMVGLDVTDETFADHHKHYQLDNVGCRILADFDSEAKAKKAAARYTNARIGHSTEGWRVEVIAGTIHNDNPDAVLKKASTIVDALHKDGGVVSLRSDD